MSRFPAIAAALTLLPLSAQAHQGDHSHVAPTHGLRKRKVSTSAKDASW